MEIKPLKETVISYLETIGLKPIKYDSDEYILFKFEGKTCYIRLHQINYLQLTILEGYDIDPNKGKQTILDIINRINLQCNCGSLSFDEEHNVIYFKTGIFFINCKESLEKHFNICLQILQDMSNIFGHYGG